MAVNVEAIDIGRDAEDAARTEVEAARRGTDDGLGARLAIDPRRQSFGS